MKKRLILWFLLAVSLLGFVVPVGTALFWDNVDHSLFAPIDNNVLGTMPEAYGNFSGWFNADNLTMSFNGLRTYVIYEIYDNSTYDGYACAYGRQGWYYFFGIYSVNDGVFTKIWHTNNTVTWPVSGNMLYYQNNTGDGYFGNVTWAGSSFELTNYRLFSSGGSKFEGSTAFNPNATSAYDYDPNCIGGTVDYLIDTQTYSAPTATPAPSDFDQNLDTFLGFAVPFGFVFVPALICAVFLGKWGFFAGMTIGAVSGYVALIGNTAVSFPVWIVVLVALADFMMLYTSARGSV